MAGTIAQGINPVIERYRVILWQDTGRHKCADHSMFEIFDVLELHLRSLQSQKAIWEPQPCHLYH